MAKLASTGTFKAVLVEMNGSHRPHSAANAPIYKHYDGKKVAVPMSMPIGSHHVAGYLAAIDVLAMAHADDVTELTIQTPANLIINQVTGVWKTTDPAMKALCGMVQVGARLFDKVDWI